MAIKNLVKWIKQNFPECVSKATKDSQKCYTLYIDAYQLFFKADFTAKANQSCVKKYIHISFFI